MKRIRFRDPASRVETVFTPNKGTLFLRVRRTFVEKLILATVIVMATLYALNAAFLYLMSVSEQGDAPPATVSTMFEYVKDGTPSTVQTFDRVPLNGLGVANLFGKIAVPGFEQYTVDGYVNLFSPDPVEYVRIGEGGSTDFYSNAYILAHEQGHIDQKALAAKVGLGYPSYWNPVRTIVFGANLYRLSSDLQQYSIEFNSKWSNAPILSSLESNAECASLANTGDKQIALFMNYGSTAGCDETQLAAAFAVRAGVWPTAENVARFRADARRVLTDNGGKWTDSLYRELFGDIALSR